MSVFLRDAQAGDIPAITGIYGQCVLEDVASYELVPPSEAEMLRRYSAIGAGGYPYIVAVDERGRVVGYAYASAFRDRPAYKWLVEDSIYLASDARRQGLGRRLLADLLAQCEKAGFRRMIAVIGGADQGSIAVHRALGFAVIGAIPASGFKFGRWLDTVLMQRALGEGDTTPVLR